MIQDIPMLPDGVLMRYSFMQPGARRYSSRATPRYLQSVVGVSKSQLPLFTAVTPGSRYVVLPFDFDGLGDASVRVVEQVQRWYPAVATACVSPSGTGVKMFILVDEYPNSEQLKLLHEKLSLPEYLVKHYLDDSYTAKHQFYANADVIHAVHELMSKTVVHTPEAPAYEYYEWPGRLSELPAPIQEVFNTPMKKTLLRVLLAAFKLTESGGWELPTTMLSAYLGCAPSTVSLILKRLQAVGWLECISHSYIIGKRSKRYVFSGILKDVAIAHKDNVVAKRKVNDSFQLPTSLSDGTWNNALFTNSFNCRFYVNNNFNSEVYFSWATSLPGSALKDRMKKAANVVKYHQSR